MNKCESCKGECNGKCLKTSNTCTACIDGMKLVNNECESCSKNDNCFMCTSEGNQEDWECYKCIDNHYLDIELKECHKCNTIEHCLACSSTKKECINEMLEEIGGQKHRART